VRNHESDLTVPDTALAREEIGEKLRLAGFSRD
jgi:hypothetical protein